MSTADSEIDIETNIIASDAALRRALRDYDEKYQSLVRRHHPDLIPLNDKLSWAQYDGKKSKASIDLSSRQRAPQTAAIQVAHGKPGLAR